MKLEVRLRLEMGQFLLNGSILMFSSWETLWELGERRR
jgi:hypothetical protein